MNKFFLRSVAIACALTFAAQAHADDWYVAPSIVHTNDDGDRNIDDSIGGGQINVGREISERLSVEGSLGYSWLSGWDEGGVQIPDEKHLDISANLLIFPNRDRAFSPYFTVGLGYLGVDYETGGDENRPSLTGGVGFLWKMGQSNVALRGEYRARLAYEDSNNLTDMIAALGVQVGFGGGPKAVKQDGGFDTDGDGVIDHWDQCPRTPRGVEVNDVGCPLRVDTDGDNDGVFDGKDECPNTPPGESVDPVGCALDSDRDGVPSDRDRCPASRPGAIVDEFGCERDDDNDGVPDHLDRCLGTAPGVRVDFAGCEIRDVIRLPGVNFETGSDRLLAGAEPLVQQAAGTLRKYTDLYVEVAGHTDSVGSAESNASLSERRAKTVRDYLVSYGVAPERLTIRGYGEGRPIADNATANGRAANRRVELRVLNQD